MGAEPNLNHMDGPEIAGTRITVYNLIPYFLDPTATESFICRIYNLTAEQVASARAYLLQNLDTVLGQHLRIEERMAAGNPPETIEQAKRTRDAMLRFKNWLTNQERSTRRQPGDSNAGSQFPTFREWLAEQQQ